MRLWLNEYDSKSGARKSIEVDFWSFMKCNFLVQLALTGIVYGVLLIFILLLALLGAL